MAFEILAKEADAAQHIDGLFDAIKAHNIWLWKKGAIEAYLGIAKSDAARMTFLNRLPEQDYREALPDYAAIAEAMAWLRI